MANGKTEIFKIPVELKVIEVERLYELQIQFKQKQDEQVTSDGGSAQLRFMWDNVYAQLKVIFGHHQPDITKEYLRDNILPQDAITILGFFAENRYVKVDDTVQEKKN